MGSPVIASAAFLLTRARKRICPKCGRVQTVDARDIRKTLPCGTCGGAVPPKQKLSSGR